MCCLAFPFSQTVQLFLSLITNLLYSSRCSFPFTFCDQLLHLALPLVHTDLFVTTLLSVPCLLCQPLVTNPLMSFLILPPSFCVFLLLMTKLSTLPKHLVMVVHSSDNDSARSFVTSCLKSSSHICSLSLHHQIFGSTFFSPPYLPEPVFHRCHYHQLVLACYSFSQYNLVIHKFVQVPFLVHDIVILDTTSSVLVCGPVILVLILRLGNGDG